MEVKRTVYSPVGRPLTVYSPLELVVAHLSAAASAAHTVAPATAAFVFAFVTVPLICPPG